jgi:hypothetical protein
MRNQRNQPVGMIDKWSVLFLNARATITSAATYKKIHQKKEKENPT